MNTIIKRFSQHPKQLLIADSEGALVTFSVLLLISQFFSIQFGGSKIIINSLSLTALLIFLYSSVCYLTLKTIHWRITLSIALVNLFYCLFTFTLMIYQHSELRFLLPKTLL